MSRSTNLNTVLRSSQGYELSRKTLQLMEQHGVWPTPENFEIWQTYAHGENLALKGAIDKLIEQNTPFTDDVCSDLAESYGSQGKMSRQIMETGGAISQHLSTVLETIEGAGRDTVAYGEALQGASGELRNADAKEVKTIIERLAHATQEMEARAESLEERLQAQTQEATKLRVNLEQVRQEAMTDALSGLPNRRQFDEKFDPLIKEAHESGAPLCVFLTDIDHFKKFNDTWGHQTGDQVIRFVASCLKTLNKGARLAARYGGEEFVVVLPDTALEDAQQVAENVRKAVMSKKLMRRTSGEDLGTVTISIGVAQLKRDETPAKVLERADEYLYQAKRSGRNRVVGEPSRQANVA